ncbi:LuxR C-terminal-related transcriptional regulator [uncultured Litoreibacter sp.]|uniref:LuxR C-terminal-related transcriptional regulator n=1 Tax=uncultured Litoreibacter sp. TaxID=1392394 RepID=UPI00261CAF39|nr:LuxR C-terminal-related transcriptional regulator [uncultured Litoreibacter sp.]
MTNDLEKKINPDGIVDQLYDIALDPDSLGTFVDAWNDAGLDAQAARQTIESIDRFDTAYRAHLDRAETFLQRGAAAESGADLAATLTPFDTLAAFIVDRALHIVAANAGAEQAFGIEEGAALSALNLPADALDIVQASLKDVFRNSDSPDRLLKIELSGTSAPALFQVRKLEGSTQDDSEHALVVTTRYHWQAALGQTLKEVFDLTGAEQGVVRALVEGLDAKSISAERGTSEGTVRGQVKSILAKMNARTQSEVIRLVISLRDVSQGVEQSSDKSDESPVLVSADWLHAEVWKPFKTLILPDGRRMDYHDMGPITGAPVLYSHMGYGLARWHEPMIKLAFTQGLRIICPIRAGYGLSENIDPKADVLESTRDDTLHLLDHLGIDRLPYLTQGNDLIFAADFTVHHPEKVSEIIGLCARPCLAGDLHYANMGKWHRFFLSTAKHAPHLLKFTTRAAVVMARRLGAKEMFRQLNSSSPADTALLEDDALLPVLMANAQLIVGKSTNVAQAYTHEILATEADWTDLMQNCAQTKVWFVNGGQDPATDIATIAEYRDSYPWIDIEVIPDAGQMLIYQHYEYLIPKIATASREA